MISRRPLAAAGGAVTVLSFWVLAVPADLSSPGSGGRIIGVTIAASAVAGGLAFADRLAGQAYVVTAYLTTLAIFVAGSIAAGDVFWPISLMLLGLVAMGTFVVSFALGRLLRTGSTMT